MRVAVIQSSYLPWRGYFDLIGRVDKFIFYDIVKYTKNDFRNRNKIRTVNGTSWLTIPIEGAAVKQRIDEVTFKDSRWQQKHYKSLSLGYAKAPCFSYLKNFLTATYLDRKWTGLSEVNQSTTRELSSLLGIPTDRFASASDYGDFSGLERVPRLLELLSRAGATSYLSGPNAKGYLEGHKSDFERLGIAVEFYSYPAYPEYPQLAKPFSADVTLVDLLMNVGEDAPNYI